jgi:hypothetical protein
VKKQVTRIKKYGMIKSRKIEEEKPMTTTELGTVQK